MNFVGFLFLFALVVWLLRPAFHAYLDDPDLRSVRERQDALSALGRVADRRLNEGDER